MKPNVQKIIFSAFPLLALAIAVTAYFFGPSEIPIWYSLSVPESQLGPRIALFLFPLSLSIIAFTHSIWIKLSNQVDPTLGRIVIWAAVLPFSILTISLIHIVLITL